MKHQELNTQTKNLFIWFIIWFLYLALATFGSKFIWGNEKTLTVIAITLNALIGIGVLIMFIRALNKSDELQKKIQLDALAIALGLGFFGGTSYSLLGATNLIPKADIEISFLLLLMIFGYMIAVFIGNKRFS
jgi:hypothetical protein